jgi:hypothetical protein
LSIFFSIRPRQTRLAEPGCCQSNGTKIRQWLVTRFLTCPAESTAATEREVAKTRTQEKGTWLLPFRSTLRATSVSTVPFQFESQRQATTPIVDALWSIESSALCQDPSAPTGAANNIPNPHKTIDFPQLVRCCNPQTRAIRLRHPPTQTCRVSNILPSSLEHQSWQEKGARSSRFQHSRGG